MAGRRDDRPDIEVVPVQPPPPLAPPGPPLTGPPPPGPPAAGAPRRAVPGAPTHGPVPARLHRGDRQTDWWRWALVLAIIIGAIVAVVSFDRRDAAEPPRSGPPTTVAGAADERPPLAESDLPVPSGMAGTLYALGEDESLIEIDLASGHARLAVLQFDIVPWFSSAVVALDRVVLVANGRQVFAVDRATLTEQQRVADERWVVAPPSGAWAALVPFGAAGGEVVVLDGAGRPMAGPSLSLPDGAVVQGATDDGLVVDFAGTLQIVRPDGTPGAVLGTGRYVASGATAVARVSCPLGLCSVLAGTVAQPDGVDLGPVDVIGTWSFANAGVFDATGTHLAVVAAAGGADGVARVFDVSGRAAAAPVDGPSAVRPPSGPPPLAFSADGATLVHGFDNQLVLWRFAGDGSTTGPGLDRLTFDGTMLAVTVTEQPPPPPPDSSGPPPSFA